MIKEIAAAIALTASANAGLPPAYEYNPNKHSGEYVATVTKGTQTAQVEMRVFGQEDIVSATLAGQSLARNYPNHGSTAEMESAVTEKAVRRYGNKPEMVKLYVNEARVAYILKMRQLNVKSGMRIQ